MAIKYNPGNVFHPQLNNEFQKVKRAIDQIGTLNAPITINSGPQAAVETALTINGSPAGAGANGVLAVNAPAGNITATYTATGANPVEVDLYSPAGQVANWTLNGNGVANFGGFGIQYNAVNVARVKHFNAAGTLILGARGVDQIVMDGANVSALGPVAGAQVDMTPDGASFTAAVQGITGTPNSTLVWSRNGKQIILFVGAASANSTSTGLSLPVGALPASIRPARAATASVPDFCVSDAGAAVAGINMGIDTAGTITFRKNGNAAGFTNTATVKGITTSFWTTYALN